MARYALTLLTAVTMLGMASATCTLHNGFKGSKTDIEKSDKLCQPQGADAWTFAMYVDAVSVPTFDGGDPLAGYVSGNSFIIFDNACHVVGTYDPGDEGNDCGIPYAISGDGLTDTLTVNSVNFSPGGASFKFTYKGTSHQIGKDHCTCQDMSHDLTGASGCKCAFNVKGAKRSIPFEA